MSLAESTTAGFNADHPTNQIETPRTLPVMQAPVVNREGRALADKLKNMNLTAAIAAQVRGEQPELTDADDENGEEEEITTDAGEESTEEPTEEDETAAEAGNEEIDTSRLTKKAQGRFQALANDRNAARAEAEALRAEAESLRQLKATLEEITGQSFATGDDLKASIRAQQEEQQRQAYLSQKALEIQQSFDAGEIDERGRDMAWRVEQMSVERAKEQVQFQKTQAKLAEMERQLTMNTLLSTPENAVVREKGSEYLQLLLDNGVDPAKAIPQVRKMLEKQGVAVSHNAAVDNLRNGKTAKTAPVSGGRDKSGATVTQVPPARAGDWRQNVKMGMTQLMSLRNQGGKKI